MSQLLEFAGLSWAVHRPRPFVLVIERGAEGAGDDYLHDTLLASPWREAFLQLVDRTGLVVCHKLATRHPSYRDVRGRSSKGRLSQGEYYHHDGCSGPSKPRVVEIRCPQQAVPRLTPTAVAPHRDAVAAMLRCLPASLAADPSWAPWREQLSGLSGAELDRLQGLITRTVRRKLKADSARAYFHDVDAAADAYVEPWAMNESRLIANHHGGATLQHRRACPPRWSAGAANGSLVKRWPNEELALPGQAIDTALLASFCSEEDGACYRAMA
ncbi:MAG: hypothetical protein ACK520_13545 [Inhella sp.]|uniref:hypothetical protein n=1 Tax=Inhella sp. TaxID=1921806 RepID=UPI0022BCA046|nr:hypothetical protein [Inhella sp.]MCZ8235861.1 hypothetical protein [Inhella sp.]